MRNESLINNRFSPGNPLPAFFAGRQEELTGFILSLTDLMQARYAGSSDKIHIVTGKHGIGKTTLLLRLKQQIQTASELEKCIPIYLSLSDIAADPATLCAVFLREVENSITSLKQRDAIVQIFAKRKWQRACAQIDGKLIGIIENLGFSGKKIPSLTTFFGALRDYFNTTEAFPQLLYFWNWLLQENGLFFVCLLDHFEGVKNGTRLLEILTHCLGELDKKHWHFFVIIAARDDYIAPFVSSAHAGRLKDVTSLFAAHHLLKIEAESDAAACAIHLNKLLVCGERMPNVALASALNVNQILNTLQQKCNAGFFTIQFDCETAAELNVYLIETAKLLAQQVNKIAGECSQRGAGNYFTVPSLGEPQFAKENNQEKVIEEFCQFMSAVDQYLQNNCPEVFIVVFWKNFEKLRDAAGYGKTAAQATAKNRLGETLASPNKSWPVGFLLFFSALSRSISQFSRLSLVPVWVSAVTDMPADTRNTALANILHQKKIWPLRVLAKEDSVQLLQEISVRSAVVIPDNTAADICQRTGGHPLLLHHFGHYVLLMLEESLSPEEIALIKNRLLKKYSQEDGGCNKLIGGPDGRTRITILPDFYKNISPNSPEDLYLKLLMLVHQQVPRKVVETIVSAPEYLATEMLLGLLKESYPKLKQEGVNSFLDELKAIKLITVEGNRIHIIHPLVKNILKEVLHIQVRDEDSNEPKEEMPTEMPTRSRIPKRASTTRKGNSNEQMAESEQAGPLLLEEAISWLDHGKLPSSSLLQRLSSQIILEATSPAFKASMRYIYMLCSQVLKRIEVNDDIGLAVSSIKDGLGAWQNQQGRYDLRNIIETKLLNAERIQNASQNKNYWSLANIHWLRYQFSDDVGELHQASRFFLSCLAEKIRDGKTQKLYWEMKAELDKHAENDAVSKNWQGLLEQASLLMACENIRSSDNLALAIKSLIPARVSTDFHVYFLSYLTELITREGSLSYVKQAAIQTIAYYGDKVTDCQEVILLLAECLQREQDLSVRQTAVIALCQIMPFLEATTQCEFLNSWEHFVEQEAHPTIRCVLIACIADYTWQIESEDLLTYFHGLLQHDMDTSIRAASWEALIRLKPLCSTEMQKELSELLLCHYQKMVSQECCSQVAAHTEALTIAIRKEAELVQRTCDFLVQGIEQDGNATLCRNCDQALATIFPWLSAPYKEKTANIYQQWLASASPEKRVAAGERLPLFYRFVPDITQRLLKIASGDWHEREILLRNLWQWLSKIETGSRALLLGKMLLWGETTVRNQLGDSDGCRMLSDLARLSPYCTAEQQGRLLQLICETLAKHENRAAVWAAESLAYLLPFVDNTTRHKLEATCFEMLLQQPEDARLLSPLLQTLAMLVSDEQVYHADILTWILQQIKRQPSLLATSGLQFFGRIWGKIPQTLSDLVYQDVMWYLAQPEYAEPAVAFMAQCGQKLAAIAPYVFRYQHHRSTMYLAFGLYELFPELTEVKNLAGNYEKMMAKDPYAFGLKLAHLHFRAGSDERAQQWITWALERVKSPLMKSKALMLLAQRQMFTLQGEAARQTLEKWHETFVGISE